MKFEFADPSDEPQVRQLLAGCELPDEDITASHLQHFLWCGMKQTFRV